MTQSGIDGKLLNWFRSYLTNRSQRVVLPGSLSDSYFINAGVPQGSILGPILFLVYINDIVEDINSSINLFAVDTSLSLVVHDPVVAATNLQVDVHKIENWARKWLVKFNPSKSEFLIILKKLLKPVHPDLNMSNINVPNVEVHKHLGLYFSCNGSWDYPIQITLEKAWNRLNFMRALKSKLDRHTLQIIYFSFIRSVLEYVDNIWDNIPEYLKMKLIKFKMNRQELLLAALN